MNTLQRADALARNARTLTTDDERMACHLCHEPIREGQQYTWSLARYDDAPTGSTVRPVEDSKPVHLRCA